MTLQFSTAVRNAMLNAIETAVGTSPIMKIRSGAQPANCAAADSGTVLATINLPSDWMAAAASGSKYNLPAGGWEDSSADTGGTAAHFRIYDSGGSTCHLQGSISTSGGGGDIQGSTVAITSGQSVKVTLFGLTELNN